jgi:biotin carboxyl carrier protein
MEAYSGVRSTWTTYKTVRDEVLVISISSEVAGTMWKLRVQTGDQVSAGIELAVIESMKMEIPVLSPCPGIVRAILVGEGDPVAVGQPIMSLDG